MSNKQTSEALCRILEHDKSRDPISSYEGMRRQIAFELERAKPIPDAVKSAAEREQDKLERRMTKDELETRIRCWGVFVRGNPPEDLYEDQLWEVMNYIEEHAHLLGEQE